MEKFLFLLRYQVKKSREVFPIRSGAALRIILKIHVVKRKDVHMCKYFSIRILTYSCLLTSSVRCTLLSVRTCSVFVLANSWGFLNQDLIW